MLSKRQRQVFSAYTDVLFGDFNEVHEYAEELLKRPVWTHEFADREFYEEIHRLSRDEFMLLISHEVTFDEIVKAWEDALNDNVLNPLDVRVRDTAKSIIVDYSTIKQNKELLIAYEFNKETGWYKRFKDSDTYVTKEEFIAINLTIRYLQAQ